MFPTDAFMRQRASQPFDFDAAWMGITQPGATIQAGSALGPRPLTNPQPVGRPAAAPPPELFQPGTPAGNAMTALRPSPMVPVAPATPPAMPPAPAAPIGPATSAFLAATGGLGVGGRPTGPPSQTKGMGADTGVVPGTDQPVAAGEAGAAKGQQAAYQPKFVQTNPFTNLGYTANSPEEELMYNAQKAGFMNAANAFGTGVGPGGRETTAREWAGVAGRGADDFLRSTLATRQMDQARQLAEADMAQRGDTARMGMANQRDIAAMEAASKNNPALLKNQSLVQMAMALAGGTITPEAFQSGMQAIDRIVGGGQPGVVPTGDSADKGVGGPAAAGLATGGVSAAELAALGAPGRIAKATEGLLAGFTPGAEGFNADAYGGSFLDNLAKLNLTDPELKQMVARVPPAQLNALTRAVMKPTAVSYYRVNPPAGIDAFKGRPNAQVPDYSVLDDAGANELFRLRAGGQSILGAGFNAALGESPYTVVVDPATGQKIDIRTAELRQPKLGPGQTNEADRIRQELGRRFLAATRQK